jgi:hypothetical protein
MKGREKKWAYQSGKIMERGHQIMERGHQIIERGHQIVEVLICYDERQGGENEGL